VTVSGGKVTGITLVSSEFGDDAAKLTDQLFSQVVERQTCRWTP
jgi:hypothetical protein